MVDFYHRDTEDAEIARRLEQIQRSVLPLRPPCLCGDNQLSRHSLLTESFIGRFSHLSARESGIPAKKENFPLEKLKISLEKEIL